ACGIGRSPCGRLWLRSRAAAGTTVPGHDSPSSTAFPRPPTTLTPTPSEAAPRSQPVTRSPHLHRRGNQSVSRRFQPCPASKQQERPAEVNATLLDFLTRLDDSTSSAS